MSAGGNEKRRIESPVTANKERGTAIASGTVLQGKQERRRVGRQTANALGGVVVHDSTEPEDDEMDDARDDADDDSSGVNMP